MSAAGQPYKRKSADFQGVSGKLRRLAGRTWSDFPLNTEVNCGCYALGFALARKDVRTPHRVRSEEHTSELQSLMRISYAVICLTKKTTQHTENEKQLNNA